MSSSSRGETLAVRSLESNIRVRGDGASASLVVFADDIHKAAQCPLPVDASAFYDTLHVGVHRDVFDGFSLVSVHCKDDGTLVDGYRYGKLSKDRASIERGRHPIDPVEPDDPFEGFPDRGVPYSSLYSDPYGDWPDHADFPEYPVVPFIPDSPDDFEESDEDCAREPEFEPIRPWIDIPTSELRDDVGFHAYEVLWRNDVTGDLLYQGFCYRVSDDNVEKPYVYMKERM